MTDPARNPRITTAVRFPPDVHEALKETAAELGVGVNWLINRAVTELLERIELPMRLTSDHRG